MDLFISKETTVDYMQEIMGMLYTNTLHDLDSGEAEGLAVISSTGTAEIITDTAHELCHEECLT